MLQVTNVRKVYGSANDGYVALGRRQSSNHDGEFLCLLVFGCGKSTLLNILAGFERADRGRGKQATERRSRRGARPGDVFQMPARRCFVVSVEENVRFGLRVRKVPKENCPQHDKYLTWSTSTGIARNFPRSFRRDAPAPQIARALASNRVLLWMNRSRRWML